MKSIRMSCFRMIHFWIIIITFIFLITMVSCKKHPVPEEHKHTLKYASEILPSCIQEGIKEHWYCDGCNKVFEDQDGKTEITLQSIRLPKTAHTIIDDVAVLPTCDTPGLTAGKHCSYCNEIIQKQSTVAQLGHNFDSEKGTWVWNGFEEAVLRFPCKRDESHAQDHQATITSDIVEPTCTSAGAANYTASVEIDGKTYTDSKESILLPLNHNFILEDIEWNWKETTEAFAMIPCEMDSKHFLIYKATIEEETVASNCTDFGKKIFTASIVVEGKTYSNQKEVELSALGHNYDYTQLEWVWNDYNSVEAIITCKNDPTHQMKCPAQVELTRVQATCTTEGRLTYVAKINVDNKEYTDTKEIIVPALNHNFDYSKPTWKWEGLDKASASFFCLNDASHIDRRQAQVNRNTIPSTCVTNGTDTYAANVKVNDYTYTYEKVYMLPLDATNHEWDYDTVSFEWIPIIDGYEALATVTCKCGKENKTEEAVVESFTTPATFEQEGKIKYTASAFDAICEENKIVVLPMKQNVGSTEEFLQMIQSESYDLTLTEDLVLTEGCRLEGEYAAIDLNGHKMTMPNYSLRIVATHAYIGNGDLSTDLDNLVGSYVIASDEGANILIENLTTFGGINIWNANAIIRNCDVTATFYYAVCAQGEANVVVESGVYRKNFISGSANTFFWIEKEGVEDGVPYQSSRLVLKDGLTLSTTTGATLYNTGGISPEFEQEPVIIAADPKEYLATDLEYKCLSIQSDLTYTAEDPVPNLSGKKVIIDLEGHTLTVPENTLKFTSTLARLRNGYVQIDDETKDVVLLVEGNCTALFDNLVITGGISVKDSDLTLKNVQLNATNSYAVSAETQSRVAIIVDQAIEYMFQPKLKITKITKNTEGSHNYYYYVEEGSAIEATNIEYETTTGATLYDPSGSVPAPVT